MFIFLRFYNALLASLKAKHPEISWQAHVDFSKNTVTVSGADKQVAAQMKFLPSSEIHYSVNLNGVITEQTLPATVLPVM